MTIARLNERELLALGMSKATVEALRHVVRQTGPEIGAITLPQVAEQTDVLNPIIAALQLADQAIQAQAAMLEAEQSNLPPSDRELRQMLDDLAGELQEQRITAGDMARQLDEQAAELQGQRMTNDALFRQVDDLTAALQEAHMTNNALERRISDLENGVN